MRANAAHAACLWSLVFGAFHFYWALGGTVGLGDGPNAGHLADDPAFLAYDLVVGALCLLGAAIALGLGGRFRRVPRRMLLLGAWTATVLLVVRGGPSLVEDVLSATGVLPGGFLGLSTQDVYGEPDPSAYTVWSMRAVDAYFALGSVLFVLALRREADTSRPLRPR